MLVLYFCTAGYLYQDIYTQVSIPMYLYPPWGHVLQPLGCSCKLSFTYLFPEYDLGGARKFLCQLNKGLHIV